MIEYLKKALFDEFGIANSEDKEVIILKDEDKVEKEYKDAAITNEMRTVVQQNIALMRESFIDMPTLKTPVIPYKDKLISMGQHDKFVHGHCSKIYSILGSAIESQ